MNDASLFNKLTAIVALSLSMSGLAQSEADKISAELLNEATGSSSEPSTVTRNEEIRRQQRFIESELKLNKGLKYFAMAEYDKAVNSFDAAINGFVSVSKTREDVLEKIKQAKVHKAESLILKSEQLIKRAELEVDSDLYSEAISTLNHAKNINPQREDEINAKIKEFKSLEKDLLFVRKVDEKGIREIRKKR